MSDSFRTPGVHFRTRPALCPLPDASRFAGRESRGASSPRNPIAVAEGLGDGRRAGPRLAREVRDRPRDAERAPRGARREGEALDGAPEERAGLAGRGNRLLELGVRDLGVGAVAVPVALRLTPPRLAHALAHLATRGRGGRRVELAPRDRPHLHLEVEAVEQRTRDPARVALGGEVVAAAVARAAPAPAAGAGIGGGDELQLRREGAGHARSRDDDPPLLEDLAQGLEAAAVELGQLVEEEDAAVGERDLAGARGASPAQEPRSARGVMRGAERALPDDGRVLR